MCICNNLFREESLDEETDNINIKEIKNINLAESIIYDQKDGKKEFIINVNY